MQTARWGKKSVKHTAKHRLASCPGEHIRADIQNCLELIIELSYVIWRYVISKTCNVYFIL